MDETKQALIDTLALVTIIVASVMVVTINFGDVDLGSSTRNMLVSFVSIIFVIAGFKVLLR
jgi:hypothetical protein